MLLRTLYSISWSKKPQEGTTVIRVGPIRSAPSEDYMSFFNETNSMGLLRDEAEEERASIEHDVYTRCLFRRSVVHSGGGYGSFCHT